MKEKKRTEIGIDNEFHGDVASLSFVYVPEDKLTYLRIRINLNKRYRLLVLVHVLLTRSIHIPQTPQVSYRFERRDNPL